MAAAMTAAPAMVTAAGRDGNGGAMVAATMTAAARAAMATAPATRRKELLHRPRRPWRRTQGAHPGTWDDAIATWEKKVEEAKKELKTKVKANVDQMKGAFDLNLAEGGGQLPCESMTIWGKSYSLCISDYAGQLSSLRVALLLMAALIAAPHSAEGLTLWNGSPVSRSDHRLLPVDLGFLRPRHL